MQEKQLVLRVLRILYRAPERSSHLSCDLSSEGVPEKRTLMLLHKMRDRRLIKHIEKDDSGNRLWMITREGAALAEMTAIEHRREICIS